MTNKRNGEIYLTIEKLAEEAENYLDNFEEINGLARPRLPSNLDCLEFTYEQLNKLTSEECVNYAYILESYALYLQRIINKENARLNWLNDKLEHLICDKLNQYDQYMKHEFKVKLIAKENTVVANLLQQINLSKQKIARLDFVAPSIKAIAKTLNDIKFTKIKRYDNGTN